MRKIYILPNLFTTASLFCGLFAILHVFNVSDAAEANPRVYDFACWLILASAILDLFDGWIARMTRTTSLFGVEYDSLSDLVAFGVAPCVLIYTRLSLMENRNAAEVIATLYAVCGALRLARFNVQKTRVEKQSFTGLPIPAAAGTVVASFLFFQRVDPEWDKQFVRNVLPIIMIGLSYLMVSQINYPSFKQFKLERRRSFDFLVWVVLLVIITMALKNYFEALVFLGFAGYVVWGVIWHGFNLLRKKPAAQPADNPSPLEP
ncbi:MAG: CDP-diacylglycerol--serine O-phosphatidyltransferase [Candidatus Sumerlaeaceae bacterium]|nr:CDP-diacylglycerol--serine O-phosphatidyltransferase [Candidatus Sumerlaeaceae bacterium]